jgi:hypothetical protein
VISVAEQYETWSKARQLIGPFSREWLRRDASGLSILLDEIGSNRRLEIRFRRVVALRAMDESFRLNTWLAQGGKATTGIFTVRHSRLIESTAEEAGGILDPGKVTHYAIYTQDDCIDVISRDEPDLIPSEGGDV